MKARIVSIVSKCFNRITVKAPNEGVTAGWDAFYYKFDYKINICLAQKIVVLGK